MAEVTDIREDKATQLPEPTGYRILVGLPEIEEKTDGGILKAKETIQKPKVPSPPKSYVFFPTVSTWRK